MYLIDVHRRPHKRWQFGDRPFTTSISTCVFMYIFCMKKRMCVSAHPSILNIERMTDDDNGNVKTVVCTVYTQQQHTFHREIEWLFGPCPYGKTSPIAHSHNLMAADLECCQMFVCVGIYGCVRAIVLSLRFVVLNFYTSRNSIYKQ